MRIRVGSGEGATRQFWELAVAVGRETYGGVLCFTFTDAVTLSFRQAEAARDRKRYKHGNQGWRSVGRFKHLKHKSRQ